MVRNGQRVFQGGVDIFLFFFEFFRRKSSREHFPGDRIFAKVLSFPTPCFSNQCCKLMICLCLFADKDPNVANVKTVQKDLEISDTYSTELCTLPVSIFFSIFPTVFLICLQYQATPLCDFLPHHPGLWTAPSPRFGSLLPCPPHRVLESTWPSKVFKAVKVGSPHC